jgi:hypothetical protein
LSGLVPYEDIDITFTGLRPGEKLFEEIMVEGEGIKPTIHRKIKVLFSVPYDPSWLAEELDKLFAEAKLSNVHGIMKSLRRLVPEFIPAYHFDKAPPPVFKRMRPDIFLPSDDGKTAAAPPRAFPRLAVSTSSQSKLNSTEI